MNVSITSLTILIAASAMSVMVHAAPAPPADPAPTPTPPPDCSPKNLSVNLPKRMKNFDWWVPQTPPGGSQTVSCQTVPTYNGIRYKSGDIRTTCINSGSSSYFSNPGNNCEIDYPSVSCNISISPGVTRQELQSAYSSVGKVNEAKNILKTVPDTDSAQNNIARVTIYCGSTFSNGEAVEVSNEGNFKVSMPSCANVDSGFCHLDPYGGLELNSSKFTTNGSMKSLVNQSGQPQKASSFYVWNKSNSKATLADGAIKFQSHGFIGGQWEPTYGDYPSDSIEVGAVAAEALACDLRVSGATSEYLNTSPPSVTVSNDVLIFTVNLKGGSGALTLAPKITFSGGPNALTGVWKNPPTEGTSVVTADVETAVSKNKFSCSLKIDPAGKTSQVRLRRFGDCGYFDALRSHYFMNPKGGFQSTKYSSPLSMPGIPGKFGLTQAEVPFGGVMNAAASTGGDVIFNSSGKVVIPPLAQRKYSKAVIVAKRFKGGQEPEAPLFYGILDLNDYSLTRLSQIDKRETINENENIVFQAFLAAAQPDGNMTRDLRGTADGLEYFSFAPATESGQPFDRVIPFTNESCVPLFQASPPIRKDMPENSMLSSVTQCLYSRPYKVADLLGGRVDLNLMHLVPVHAHHQFPTDMLKASNQPACVAKNPTAVKECWDVKASSMGVAANANPFASHDACRTESTTWVTTTANSTTRVCSSGGGNGGGMSCRDVKTSKATKVPVTTVTYKASCPVLESKSECSKNTAIRFSGFNQMMIASLGCAAKYDRAGELVAASLVNQGIIPYTSALGGSNPHSYQTYPKTQSANGNPDGKGFACIPCRFANDAIADGKDIIDQTGTLPVDQDASAARKPVFSFKKMKAPTECVRDITFEVRYFGSDQCNGVSAPPGHFCSSSNLGGQSCSASDGMGSGNVAGKFTIPVCPNSGFEYDNISVSWSPLLIDVFGNGIEVTRDPQYAVKFDIRGDGKQRIVDWPLNVKEVAFLVLPNKKGKVESGKELFGDYKSPDGFAALAKYDKNKDLKIDRQDSVYESLRLWFDRNRNGVQEAGELEALKDNGIETVYLEYRKITNRGTDGRTLSSVYYNSKYREYMNIGDYYFNEYGTLKKKK